MDIINIKNLHKTFLLKDDKKSTIKSLIVSFLRQGKTRRFKALDGIDLKINSGEFVGIIGKNGSGKSTLLKIIAGIYNPDTKSTVNINGRVIPFLELGVGFNNELTGKENVYLNGTILGMSKKYLDKKYDEIVAFAELENFINVPVKNYSSGMQVRLAFSIAIQADGDIYILDEILGVGDENFQQKSINKIKEFSKQGKTILFVTHNSEAIVEYCNRGVLIDEGKVSFDGDPQKMIDKYHMLYPPHIFAK